jgi:hypothetical protein
LDRVGEAFAHYAASNETLRIAYRSTFEAPGIETAAQRVARLVRYFETADEKSWRVSALTESPAAEHVFLVGFPRSGTTLLEHVMASHPQIETLEERDLLIDAGADFIVPREGLAKLSARGGEDLAPYREAYWKRAAENGLVRSRSVFVDKMPLNSILLCLVAKLFPGAKVLIALRDPRDVVLSCFRRRFGMTAQMYELLTLEGAARYYDAVNLLLVLYRRRLGLQTHTLRYEDLIANFEGETARLCMFLDIPMNAAMANFAVRARERVANTPSAAQVARGLFTQGVGQWRRYRQQLTPVMPILAPWVERHGYETN